MPSPLQDLPHVVVEVAGVAAAGFVEEAGVAASIAQVAAAVAAVATRQRQQQLRVLAKAVEDELDRSVMPREKDVPGLEQICRD